MATLREWISRLWGTLRPSRNDRELEEELRLHLELAAEDARQRASTAESALRAARIQAGGVAQAMAVAWPNDFHFFSLFPNRPTDDK